MNTEVKLIESKYKKIQFIGLAISTTPGDLNSIEEMSDDGCYLGTEDIEEDINARLLLLQNAIEHANKLQDKDEKTLKIFTIPEFYFRGNKGAYFGEAKKIFNTYFKKFVHTFLAKEDFQNWLFVLGTLVTSTMEVNQEGEPTKSLFPLGDQLLNVYYRLHPKENKSMLGSDSNFHEVRSVRRLLKQLDDGTEQLSSKAGDTPCCLKEVQSDTSYISVLAATLNYCDMTSDLIVDNRCIIVEGGKDSQRIIHVLKQHKSKEDFILNGVEKNYIQSITHYKEIEEKSEWKETDEDEYSMFVYYGIRFGVEICLDHSRKRLMKHLKKYPKDLVDVQLIVSCGMDIRNHSVIARKDGYVFNCDGEYVLADSAENGEHCHTMLKSVISSAHDTEPATLTDHIKLEEGSKLNFQHDGKFYPCSQYQLHMYPAFDVKSYS